MRMRRDRGHSWVFVVGLILIGREAFAAGAITDLRLFRRQDLVRAEVRATGLLDERTTLTVESGLPGTCLYLFRLEDRAGRAVAERYLELSLRFDLWENRYLLQSGDGTIALPTLAAADSALSYLPGAEICPLSRLRSGDEYRLVLQIAVRPLAPEDRERLSTYVNRNSAGGREEVAVDLGALFGRVMEEKEGARQVVRQASPFFRATDLPEAP